MHLYVVRHGSTFNNLNGLINGRNDIDINEKGIRDAQGASLLLNNVTFDRVISSPLLRAKHTADIIVNGKLPISYDERISERDAGVLTNKKVTNINLDNWYSLDVNYTVGGAETFSEVVKRVNLFLEELKLKYPDETILIVTHAGIMKALEVCIYGYPGIDEIKNWRYSNGVVRDYIL